MSKKILNRLKQQFQVLLILNCFTGYLLHRAYVLKASLNSNDLVQPDDNEKTIRRACGTTEMPGLSSIFPSVVFLIFFPLLKRFARLFLSSKLAQKRFFFA